ncbi:MAG: hypothetical protein QG597_2377 [Actinomycetota bacterium]|nr:hypothetical protein [Actinomycetota bacterium]
MINRGDQAVAQKVDVSQLGVLDKLGQGGQGIVYRAPSVHSTYAKSMVYKAYKPATLASLDADALAALPEFLESLPYSHGARLISLAAWPCVTVHDGGKTVGFLMPSIPEEFFTEIWTNKPSPSTVMAEFQHLLNDPHILAMRFRGSEITEHQRLELLHQLALALAFLHEHGVVVGDISPKNVLYSLSPNPAVYFVDCDAMRVKGVSPSTQVETPGWAVPHGEEKATVYSDRYKLGLMALRLLVGDQGTKDVKRLPDYVPEDLRGVIRYTLSNDPQDRPELLAWDTALKHAIATAPKHQKRPAHTSPPAPAYPSQPPTVVLSPPQSHPSAPSPVKRSRPSRATPVPPSPQPLPGAAPIRASNSASWLLVSVVLIGLFVLGALVWNGGNSVPSQPTTASAPYDTTRTVIAPPETETVTRTAIPSTRPPNSTPPTRTVPSGDLGLSVPMRNPPCDGRGIVILTSVTTPGKYVEGVAAALSKFPGSSYLRTDLTCPSLRADLDGNPIYAVYRPGGWTRAQLCAAVAAAGPGAYGKFLDYSTPPSYIPC